MVFFICDGCNESMKKSQVDNHAARCRSCHSVSCVDCNVSFYGDDYRDHTSCISEAERYQKTLYQDSKKKTKKSPQEAWNEIIAEAASTAPQSLKSYLHDMVSLGNVPRKEKPFQNFTKNSLKLGRSDEMLVKQIWNHMVTVRDKKECRAKKENNYGEKNGNTTLDTTKGNEKSMETGTTNNGMKNGTPKTDSTTNDNDSQLNHKVLSKTMKKILKKAPNQQLKFKRLRKEVKCKLQLEGKKKELKKMLLEKVEENKKMKFDGKLVILVN